MPTSLLCETVTGDSMADLLAARDGATLGDMVELRLDGVADLDVAGALRGRRGPVIVTCRARWEGGRFDGAEETRRQILIEALDLGAEFVDVEWSAGFDDVIRRDASRVVVSMHDFEGVPSDLDERVRAMRATGARTIKVAVMPLRLTDTLQLVAIARTGDAVVVGMDARGVPSRLLASRYGSRWTYAGNGIAPGQIPAAQMIGQFRFRSIGPETRLFGVVSPNALHSLSPAMHNAAFSAAGVDAVYVPLCAGDYDDFLSYTAALGFEGASVTIPFKLDALRSAASADELTRAVGAANTLRRGASGWEATNTDVDGFLVALDNALGASLQGTRAAVLGAGGSARAVVVGLLSRGARVSVHTRRVAQGREVAEGLGASVGAWPPGPGSWDLLVNCTPLGGAGRREESPLPNGPFDGRLVYDLNYGPGATPLLRAARAAGCATVDGLPMLVAQAERQFEWWTGQRPASGVMAKAADAALAGASTGRDTTVRSQGVYS